MGWRKNKGAKVRRSLSVEDSLLRVNLAEQEQRSYISEQVPTSNPSDRLEDSFVSEIAAEDRKNSQTACVICYDSEMDTVIIPCGHGSFCNICAVGLFERGDHCPICRSVTTLATESNPVEYPEDLPTQHKGQGERGHDKGAECLGNRRGGRERRQ